MENKTFINFDIISSIEFTGVQDSYWEFYSRRPKKTFLGFTIKKELPSGWYHSEDAEWGYESYAVFSSPKQLLEQNKDCIHIGDKIMRKAYINIRQINNDYFREYFDTNELAMERINNICHQSKAIIRISK